MLTPQQKAAALYASVAFGCVNVLLELEKPTTARHNRLKGANDQFMRCVDLYRTETFPKKDMDRAGDLIDLVKAEVTRMYGGGRCYRTTMRKRAALRRSG